MCFYKKPKMVVEDQMLTYHMQVRAMTETLIYTRDLKD